MAVNVKVLLSESLLDFYLNSGGNFLDFGIAYHRILWTLAIIAHFTIELPRIANWYDIDILFLLNFLNTGLNLDALIDVFYLMEDLGRNLIAAVQYFERLVL